MSAADHEVVVRRATPDDRSAVIELLGVSLGRERDARAEALYAWKHEENVFGRSPAWVACDGARLVGFRVLMPWDFVDGDRVVHAVRAVDTATDPDYQGRGVFTRLTLRAVEELRDEGVQFVFNTPNDKSRPGYLKMGWQPVGRLATVVRPTSASGLVRMAKARVPAERWSSSSDAARAADDVLADRAATEELVASLPRAPGLRTRLSADYLRWRYATPFLGYRALTARRGLAAGVALFRIRRRGGAREAALCDVLAPGGDRRVVAELTRGVARESDADYVIRLAAGPFAPGPMVRLPGQGPLLTWRSVADPVPPRAWSLSLGDIELF